MGTERSGPSECSGPSEQGAQRALGANLSPHRLRQPLDRPPRRRGDPARRRPRAVRRRPLPQRRRRRRSHRRRQATSCSSASGATRSTLQLGDPRGRRTGGRSLIEGGKRELAEETGYHARDWREIVRFATSNSVTDEEGALFVATGLEAGDARPDGSEPGSRVALGLARRGGGDDRPGRDHRRDEPGGVAQGGPRAPDRPGARSSIGR